jgi:uncharacterized membrane protein YkoI
LQDRATDALQLQQCEQRGLDKMERMRGIIFGAAALIIAGAMGAIAIAYDHDDDENETAIALSQVPQLARDAAQKQLGGAIREAKVIEQKGQKIYELEGQASGQKMSVHVTADGNVVQREKDDD